MDERYDPSAIEAVWQKRWADARVFSVGDAGEDKFYLLEMFAYPSGRIHMGHVRNYSIGDVVARHLRMRGKTVLHPSGWDAFGMPAENAAIERRRHPRDWTHENIEQMRGQLTRLGLSYDWEREVTTCESDYYRHEQEMFLSMLEHDLAYRKHALANWCETCATVLANEQVEDGQCWRCGGLVVQKAMPQWFLRTTRYAEELLTALDTLEGKWPSDVLQMQRNWIGRSTGAEVVFPLEAPAGDAREVRVFTTRPDTLYGVTFMSLAAEHPLALALSTGTPEEASVKAFVEATTRAHAAAKGGEVADKEGVFTGRYCVHPLSGAKIPIWVANFVLMDYGTGAVMAVPAHDQRDFEFARAYGLPLRVVIRPEGRALDASAMTEAYVEPGMMVNSGPFDGTPNEAGKQKVAELLATQGKGGLTVSYRLRDWLVSRQRYWGAPIPVVHCDKDGVVLVPRAELPVELPRDVEITGTGGSPLARHAPFVNATCPKCGAAARRETDTFDTFVESSWYFDRFTTPHHVQAPVDAPRARAWLPVDLYIGGKEHAVMHLLYARFWQRMMIDLGYLPKDTPREPFSRLICQGMVSREYYATVDPKNPAHTLYHYPEDTEVRAGVRVVRATGETVTVGPVVKMSKTRRNTVEPDEIIARYGADTARLFVLFAAPPEGQVDWTEAGVEGAYRFLGRVWRLVRDRLPAVADVAAFHPGPTGGGNDVSSPSLSGGGSKGEGLASSLSPDAIALRRAIHRAIQRVTFDLSERCQPNTAIAAQMELVNALVAFAGKDDTDRAVMREGIEALVHLLAPFAPHLADELWSRLGGTEFLIARPWPRVDEAALAETTIEVPVQVNGKVRDRIRVAADASEATVLELARASEKVRVDLEGKTVKRAVYVPKKIVTLVVE